MAGYGNDWQGRPRDRQWPGQWDRGRSRGETGGYGAEYGSWSRRRSSGDPAGDWRGARPAPEWSGVWRGRRPPRDRSGESRGRAGGNWSREPGREASRDRPGAYGTEYAAGRYADPRGYPPGRHAEYDAEYDDVRRGGRGLDFGQHAIGRGEDQFRARKHRHYGDTPVDRWPSHDSYASHVASERMSDEDVTESVRENLFHDSFLDPDRIHVSATDGVVTLSGEVDDFLEARYAWDDAWESPGVRGVVNELTVRADRSSDEIDTPQTRAGSRGGWGPR